TFSITVTLSAASDVNTTIPFTLGGTAVNGADYGGVTASPLVILAGQTTGTITGTLIADGKFGTNNALTCTLASPPNDVLGAIITGILIDDGTFSTTNNTLQVILGPPVNAVLGINTSDLLTIVESDPPPLPTIPIPVKVLVEPAEVEVLPLALIIGTVPAPTT